MTTPCVEATEGWDDGHGYLATKRGGVQRRAQTWAWLDAGRPLPEGYVLDHLCRNRRCVRFDHLEPVTDAENVSRGRQHWAATREACSKGHPWTEGNTYRAPDGTRYCRECGRSRKRAYKARKRAERATTG